MHLGQCSLRAALEIKQEMSVRERLDEHGRSVWEGGVERL